MNSTSICCVCSAITIGASGCATLSEWNAHPDSYFTRDETVAVKFYGDGESYSSSKDLYNAKKCNEMNPEPVSLRVSQEDKRPAIQLYVEPVTTAVAAAVAGIAVDQAVKALEEEKSRYTARFSGRYVGQFYKENGTPRFKCFSVQRTVGGGEEAMFFLGAIQLSPDGTAMQIVPLALRYSKLKAKALWTDQTAAVAITLDFASAWKDRNDGFHSERTASVAMYSQDVDFGDGTDRDLTKENYNQVDRGSQWIKSDWMIPVIPSTYEKSNKKPLGNFSLTVTVVESTETGADVVGLVAETLREKKSSIIDAVIGPTAE